MNRMSRYFMALAFAAVLSAGVSVPSLAAVKITKNTADWVLEAEQKRAEQEAQEEAAAAEAAAAAEEAASAEAQEEAIRAQVVDYALSFVGGRYVYGGNDPHSGVDCSGFTRYVLGNAAGVALGRSSRDQAAEGTTVSAEQMQPGDLLFYGSGSHVNHVAMYIGDGKVVHASTERTGIKTSPWNYRTPVKIVNVLG